MGHRNTHHGLSDDEVRQLKKNFKVQAGFDRKLNYNEFISLFKLLNPNVCPTKMEMIAQRAFSASDINGDGKLNFDEFINAYKLTKSNDLCGNVKCILNDYDPCHQNRGWLTQDEAHKYICYMHKFYGQPKQCDPNRVYTHFHGNNRIRYSDFADYAAIEFKDCAIHC